MSLVDRAELIGLGFIAGLVAGLVLCLYLLGPCVRMIHP